MTALNIAVIVGSNRRDSINRKLGEALVRLGGDRVTAQFLQIDDLPMYNPDLEAARPESAKRLSREIREADGLIILTPEHNRSLPAVLKNALDWASRPYGESAWAGKLVAITGTSPSPIGTATAQQHLRQILGVMGAHVVGGEAYISFKPDLIDAKGEIGPADTRAFLQNYLDQFLNLAGKLSGKPARAA